jgi:formylglycine-generating enzyme required for sulfatase activity
MSGNVEEWTCSGYGEKYDGEGICFSENNYKPVTRGGSFFYKEDIARSVRRGFNDSNAQTNDLGFRLASD